MFYVGGAGVTCVSPATAARFFDPSAICCDSKDNIYVVDRRNFRIRKIAVVPLASTDASSATSTGSSSCCSSSSSSRGYVVSTFVGNGYRNLVDGVGTRASMRRCDALTCDSSDYLYMNDSHLIRKISPSGHIGCWVGGQWKSGRADGVGTHAAFNGPIGLTCDHYGYVYVADSDNHRICSISSDGVVRTVGGDGFMGVRDGIAFRARFAGPCGVAYDTVRGGMWIVDSSNHRVRFIE